MKVDTYKQADKYISVKAGVPLDDIDLSSAGIDPSSAVHCGEVVLYPYGALRNQAQIKIEENIKRSGYAIHGFLPFVTPPVIQAVTAHNS